MKNIITEKEINKSIFLIISGILVWTFAIIYSISKKDYFLTMIFLIGIIPSLIHTKWLNDRLIERHEYYKDYLNKIIKC